MELGRNRKYCLDEMSPKVLQSCHALSERDTACVESDFDQPCRKKPHIESSSVCTPALADNRGGSFSYTASRHRLAETWAAHLWVMLLLGMRGQADSEHLIHYPTKGKTIVLCLCCVDLRSKQPRSYCL